MRRELSMPFLREHGVIPTERDVSEKDRLHSVNRDRRGPHHWWDCHLDRRQQHTVRPEDNGFRRRRLLGRRRGQRALQRLLRGGDHALEATGGLRYAELDREDPLRETAATASFLQASLYTSVVAFGVAAMAILIGVLFILIGMGIRDVASRITATTSSAAD